MIKGSPALPCDHRIPISPRFPRRVWRYPYHPSNGVPPGATAPINDHFEWATNKIVNSKSRASKRLRLTHWPIKKQTLNCYGIPYRGSGLSLSKFTCLNLLELKQLGAVFFRRKLKGIRRDQKGKMDQGWFGWSRLRLHVQRQLEFAPRSWSQNSSKCRHFDVLSSSIVRFQKIELIV